MGSTCITANQKKEAPPTPAINKPFFKANIR